DRPPERDDFMLLLRADSRSAPSLPESTAAVLGEGLVYAQGSLHFFFGDHVLQFGRLTSGILSCATISRTAYSTRIGGNCTGKTRLWRSSPRFSIFSFI